MTETQADARRLTSIDAATSLGQLADEVVVAVIHWRADSTLNEHDAMAVRQAAQWLESTSARLADPLSLEAGHDNVLSFPGPDSFGPGLADAALGVLSANRKTDETIAALDALKLQLLAIADGSADERDAERLLNVFEGIARAMLSAADSLLAPATRTKWAMTSAF
jgi:hypothetical protein